MATPTRGGYEYQFVTTPADWLICNICQYPSREPYLSGCCGHTFCKSCLEGAKKVTANKTCPMCRSESEFITMPNKQVDRLVRSLHVFCTNKEKGCEWQGEVNDIINHLGNSDGCQFEEVTCSNDCGKCLQRQYLSNHVENECVRRKIDCQYCHIAGEHQFIEGEHKGQCPKFPIACPNKCEVGSVLRDDVEEHMKMCPLELIHCEYRVVGCEERMARKDQKKHNKEKMEEHLFLSVTKVAEISKNLTFAKIEQQETKDKLTNTQRDLNTTKQQLVTTCQNLIKAENDYVTLADKTDEALAKLETTFQTKITEIETAAQKRITELEAKIELLLSPIRWTTKLWEKASKSSSGDQVVPVIIKISEYTMKQSNKIEMFSVPFYTHGKGYHICLCVNTSRHSFSYTSLSVYVYLMKGLYDDQLKWPLKGYCEVKLLNQIGDSEHHLATLSYNGGTTGGKRVYNGGRGGDCVCFNHHFIFYQGLHNITNDCQYLKNDNIFLEVVNFTVY